MKKILLGLFSLFLIITLACGWIGYSFFSFQSTESASVFFKKGTSLRQMARQLEEKNLISSAILFEAMVRTMDAGKNIKAGEYEFDAGLSASQILNKLIEGKVKLYSLVIPEGYNLKDIEKIFIEKGLVTNDTWQELINDKSLLSKYDLPGPSLEGYLFPDTYLYDKESIATAIINQMLLNFKKQSDALKPLLSASGMDFKSWVTLASIVEKETGKASERPVIASVFLNRLKINMPLQTDPTVIYGIENFNGNITRADLERDTPYNTYTRGGLPPGPICSPGLESLKAVLSPADTTYLYFVAQGNGGHYFSTTYEEHVNAVNRYQRGSGQ